MKKILSILGSMSVVMSGTSSIMAMSPNINTKALQSTYSTNSFTDIVKIINTKFSKPEVINQSKEVDALLKNIVPTYYYNSFNGKKGTIRSWDMKPRNDEKVIAIYPSEYENPSDDKQKCKTISKEYSVTNKHSFSMSISEKIATSIETSFESTISAPFLAEEKSSIGLKFTNEIGKEQKWTNEVDITNKEIAPSQEIIQRPHTILKVQYIIKQGTYDCESVVNFKIDNLSKKIFNIPQFHFNKNGNFNYMTWNQYSVLDVIKTLKELGYDEQIKNDDLSKYSVFSVDDINNPKDVYVNLPVTWSSQSTYLSLKHYQEPLS